MGVHRQASNHVRKIIQKLTNEEWRKHGERRGQACLRTMQKIARNKNLAQGAKKGKNSNYKDRNSG
jgi:hypothetical protein